MRLKRRSQKIGKFSFMLVWVMLLQMILQPFSALTFAAPAIEGFTLEKSASASSVEVGEEFSYYIDYAYQSSTLPKKNIKLVDAIPGQFEIIQVPVGWELDGQTLSWGRELSAGDSGTFEIRVKARATGSADPVVTTNTVIATEVPDSGSETRASANVAVQADPNPSTPTPVPTPTPVEVTYDRWETFKEQATGFGGNVPIVGGTVTYKVGIKGLKGNTGTGSLDGIILIDQLPVPLPAGTTVDFPKTEHNGYRQYDESTGIITWNIPSLAPAGSTLSKLFEDEIRVTFPEYYGYSLPDPATNSVTLSVYSVNGEGAVGGANSNVTVSFGKPVAGVAGLTKKADFEYRYQGQSQKFTIGGIRNNIANANSSLTNLVLTDTLPRELDYTSISLPGGWSSFQYRTSSEPAVWKPAAGLAPSASSVSIGANGDIALADGEYLTEVQWIFNELKANAGIGDITIEGIVRSELNGASGTAIEHGHTVTNEATLTYDVLSQDNPGVRVPATPKTAAASFKINNPKPWLIAEKSFNSSSTYGPLSVVPFTLKITNDSKATGDYVNPVIYDLLPASFSYYADPAIGDREAALAASYSLGANSAAVPLPKLEIVAENYNGTGRTLVKWYWDTEVRAKPGTGFEIKYQAQIEAGTPADTASYVNDLHITTGDKDAQFWHNGDRDTQTVPDSLEEWRTRNSSIHKPELPSDGNNAYYVSASVSIPVASLGLVQSTKWNRGDLESIFRAADNPEYEGEPGISVRPFPSEGAPEYTEFPYYSVTFEGGTADYKLAIRNSGNTRLEKVDVLDILPHIGDEALLSRTPRNSQWQPNLAEVLKSGEKTFTSTPETGSRTVKFTLASYYSKSVNQDTVVNFENARGSRNGWLEQASFSGSNLSDIRSLYFEISDITGSDGQPGLRPGDYIVLDWKMDAPVGAPANKIAWNSFAIQAKELNSSRYMLPTAPNKVGFIIDPDSVHEALGEIGDFVWFDSDRDGIQNERFDGDSQKSGINGITVNLYKEGEAEPLRSSKTGYDVDGNPGYYLFQGLELDQGYAVEFVVPKEYQATSANQGGDPHFDSNLVTATENSDGTTSYRTENVTLTLANRSDRTIDLGLVEAEEPAGHPAAELTKTIAGVENGSAPAASQDYAVAGNKVKYAIEFANTSSVALHNIKVTDQLDRGQPGFVFTKLIYADEEIAIDGNNHGRPDVISQLSNDGAEPYIVVKSLEAGGSFRLEGEYTVSADDIDLTELVNKVTAVYNEAAGELEDEAAIPTASIQVKKTGSALSVSAQGQIVDYTVAVTNTGSYDLHNVVITDSKVSGLPVIPLLQSGETKEISYSYTVTTADLIRNVLENIAKAKPDEIPEDTDTHEVPVVSAPRGSIGNYVWQDSNEDGIQDDGENGINGIVVKLYATPGGEPVAQTVTRDQDGKAGYYLFQGLLEGTYYVHFSIPADYGVTVPEAGDDRELDSNKTDENGYTEAIIIGPSQWDDLSIDLGLVPRGEIGDYVWLDGNRDGLQNDDDAGINGIEVRLYKGTVTGEPAAVAYTADDKDGNPGYYLFDDLLAGEYYVQFIVPADYELSPAEQGADRAEDSNATDEQGFTAKIAIGESQWVNHTIDLGLIPKGAIGNYVWLDSNGNGRQDEAAAYGRNGVTVRLYDAGKNLVKETVTANDASGNSGYYLFDNLVGGDYYVGFVIPGGLRTTLAEADGASPEEDSNKLTDGLTEVIVIGEAAGWEDLSVDLGLRYIPSNPGPYPTPTTTPGETPTPEPGTASPTPAPSGGPTPSPTPAHTEQPEVPINNEQTPKDTPKEGEVELPGGGTPEVGKQPDHGTVEVDEDGKWIYTPEPGYTGKDNFSIIIKDEDGDEEEIWFEIDVEDVPLGGIDPDNPGVGVLPKTGESSVVHWQVAGLGLVVLGAALRRKYRLKR